MTLVCSMLCFCFIMYVITDSFLIFVAAFIMVCTLQSPRSNATSDALAVCSLLFYLILFYKADMVT